MENDIVIGKVMHIEYTNARDESSERWIVPTSLVSPNIKAIDISDFLPEQREEWAGLIVEYLETINKPEAAKINFQNWTAEAIGYVVDFKFRTFNLSRLKVLD